MAAERNLRVILNPAPACQLPDSLLATLSLLTPNEVETQMLTGILPDTRQNAVRAARQLQNRGVETVLITLGARGALLVTREGATQIPAPRVDVLDTTAAGDAFNGALACAIGEGQPLEEAVRFANCAGAITVSGRGAQPAIPNRRQILECLTEWDQNVPG